MKITKRNGKQEELKFDKISKRIERQTYKLNELVDSDVVATKVIQGLYEGISTEEIDLLASETAASLITSHPDYSHLAARLAITALQKDTPKKFTDTIENLHKYIHPETGEPAGLISDEIYDVIMKNEDLLNSSIIGDRDFNIDYFGFKTLERSYLLKINGKVAERIQHFWMRISVGIWGDNIEEALKTYELLSNKRMIHATPTLFNAGTKKPQMSSCFLLQMKDDSIRGIYETLMQCAEISQSAGGIGFHMSNIRATGAYIKGTNGVSNGIVPMLRNFDMTARYVDQGGGKRKGSFAAYIEPWHADIMDFLDLKKNHGKEERRARDLFYAIWNSDLFMERVNKDEDWTLMSPDVCPGLQDAYGEDFKNLYEKYEQEGKGLKTIKARDLWNKIIESQTETGTPYMLYKDSANLKSNQKNIGTIKSSNLCCEIMEVSNPDEVAVCNLGSIALPTFIKSSLKRKTKKLNRSKLYFDFHELYDVAYQLAKNLNRVIDVNFYPVPEAKNSNMRNRPIGMGVQGLADTFAILGLAFDSEEAKQLNKDIFETIYFAAVTSSKDSAKVDGPYETYKGSPMSEGIFQFDMWEDRKVERNKETKEWEVTERKPIALSGRWDWDALKEEVKKYGVRNSLLVAPMPTASTAQILGNNECFEPFTSNIYKRNTLSGEFAIINKHLVKDLVDLEIWSQELSDKIVSERGSIQNVPEIPTHIKELYKTVWEMKMRDIIDMSADRGAFVDQSQSLNLFIKGMNDAKLTGAHFYGWLKGLKTGMYYLRTESAADANAALGASSHKEVEKTEEAPLQRVYVWSGCPEGKYLEDMTVLERRQYDLEHGNEGEECLSCSG